MSQESKFKDSTNLTLWLKRGLYANIVVSIIGIISGALEYQLLNNIQKGVYDFPGFLAIEAIESNDIRQSAVYLIQIIVFLITFVLYLRWIYRANSNARSLGATGMRFTPGWAIGFYFIPIMCFWKPYQSMKEIWQASANPDNWREHIVPILLPWWWFFWLSLGFLAYFELRFYLKGENLEDLEDVSFLIISNIFLIISNLLEIVLGFIGIAIVGKIHEMQMSHISRA